MSENTPTFASDPTTVPAPELTLTPNLSEPTAGAQTLSQSVTNLSTAMDDGGGASALDDSMLTEEERKSVEAFSRQIDLSDSAMILSYGSGSQKKMADFSEAALANVRTQEKFISASAEKIQVIPAVANAASSPSSRSDADARSADSAEGSGESCAGAQTLSQPVTNLSAAMDDGAGASALDDSMLTEEEKESVEAFSRQIDLSDSAMLLSYGSGAQKKMADFSEAALANVRTQDLGEVGDLIAGVVTELREFDATEEKGLFGFFKKGANKIESLRNRYDKAEANVDRIVKTLQDHQMKLMKVAATLDKMYELNLTYFKELTMYLLAGKRRLEEVRAGDLAQLVERARQTGRAEDAQAAQDMEAKCTRFEKKLADLDLTRTIAMQTAPQIRLVQGNEMTMIERSRPARRTRTSDRARRGCAGGAGHGGEMHAF